LTPAWRLKTPSGIAPTSTSYLTGLTPNRCASTPLQEVHLLLHADLHPGVEDRVAVFFARGPHEEREDRAPIHFGERHDVQHSLPFGRFRHLVDLGRDDPLVGDDLAVLAVEGDFESAVRDHHVPPPAADPQVDLGDRHLASVAAPPALDQLRRGPRLVDQMLWRVELPGDEELLIGGERHRRRPASRHCHHLLSPGA